MSSRGGGRSGTNPKKSGDGELPDYGQPPVSEVACGIAFEPLKRFLVPHIGLYWNRIRDAFPTCEHAAPFSANLSAEPGWVDPATSLPLPRVWFISPNRDRLIQLQGDCFFYNWRRLSDQDVYPRYKRLIGEYRELLNGFLAFLAENKFSAPSVMNCELTYVNHIPQEHGWTSAADLSKVFKDYCWSQDRDRYLPAPKQATWRVQFDMPHDRGNLVVNVAPGQRVKDQMPTLKLELTAKTKVPGSSVAETEGWFDTAHEWIVRGFSDLTQENFQKSAWKKIDG